MMARENMRIDKWLWCVRLFKSRSMAADACDRGWITMDGFIVKPSRAVRQGDTVQVKIPPMVKTIYIKELPPSRVSAKLLSGLIDDLTPDTEYEKLETFRQQMAASRPRGSGRPTKRERREIDQFFFDV